jgi:hypothetical protein
MNGEGSGSCPAPYLTSFPYDLVFVPSPVNYMDFYCIFLLSAERGPRVGPSLVYTKNDLNDHEITYVPASFAHLTHSPLDTNEHLALSLIRQQWPFAGKRYESTAREGRDELRTGRAERSGRGRRISPRGLARGRVEGRANKRGSSHCILRLYRGINHRNVFVPLRRRGIVKRKGRGRGERYGREPSPTRAV